MKKFAPLLLIFLACEPPKINVELTAEIDPDIVLVNIGEGNRAFLGDLLWRINRCDPKLVGIHLWKCAQARKPALVQCAICMADGNSAVPLGTHADTRDRPITC